MGREKNGVYGSRDIILLFDKKFSEKTSSKLIIKLNILVKNLKAIQYFKE